jgi:hypothetical protein
MTSGKGSTPDQPIPLNAEQHRIIREAGFDNGNFWGSPTATEEWLYRFARRLLGAAASPSSSPSRAERIASLAQAIAWDDCGNEVNGYLSWENLHSCGGYGCCGGGKDIDRKELERAIHEALTEVAALPLQAEPPIPSHLLGEDEPCSMCGSRLANCECPAEPDPVAPSSALGEWREIASAPKDGTPVRLRWEGTTVEAVGKWVVRNGWPEGPSSSDSWTDVKGGDVLRKPTHWALPLPPRPGGEAK